jgi:hypothetical protein
MRASQWDLGQREDLTEDDTVSLTRIKSFFKEVTGLILWGLSPLYTLWKTCVTVINDRLP